MIRFNARASIVTVGVLLGCTAAIAADSGGDGKKPGIIGKMVEAGLKKVAERIAGGSVDYLKALSCRDPNVRGTVIRDVLDYAARIDPRANRPDVAASIERNVILALDCGGIQSQPSLPIPSPPAPPPLPPSPPPLTSPSPPPPLQTTPVQITPKYLIVSALKSTTSNDLEGAERFVMQLDAYPKPVRPTDRRRSQQLNGLGLAKLRAGLFPDAAQDFRESVNADPGSEEALNNWGLALVKAGSFEDGEQVLQRALTLAPRSGNAWLIFGYWLGEQNYLTDATAAYRLAYRYSKTPQVALTTLINNASDMGLQESTRSASRQAAERILGKKLLLDR